MKNYFFSAISISLLIANFLLPTFLFAQSSGFAQVTVGPNVSICNGCTTLTATVQGSVATTSYSVAPTAYTPFPYNVGTAVLVNIDDTWSSAINIPFCFQFFGNTYTQVVIVITILPVQEAYLMLRCL